MTKETRTNVFEQIKDLSDLQVGDRISFKAVRGSDMRMNSSFTFGGIRNGYLLDADGFNAASHVVFGSTISGWDSTEWQVWRKVTPVPTHVGAIIQVAELNNSRFQGLAILRSAGSWQGINNPDIRFGAANVQRWNAVEINVKTN